MTSDNGAMVVTSRSDGASHRSKSPKLAVVGCGHWGKNLVRNFHHLGALKWVCDVNTDQLTQLRQQFKGLQTTNQFDQLLSQPDLDGIVISTPSASHFRLAYQALLAQKHVYVEKPIATTTHETLQLVELAADLKLHLMVGHLLLYHPAVNRLKQLIEVGYLGEIRYIQSDRLNMNPYRSDRTVFWDLAPHDLSMMMYLIGRAPQRVVSVLGSKTSQDDLVDIAHIELDFGQGLVGHIHNSWVHPFKQVKLIVRGTLRSAVIDDTLPLTEKLQVFEHNKPQDKELPSLLSIEPLKLECQHFINCIRSGRPPKSDGVNGTRVVEILEEAESKMQLSTQALTLIQ